MIPQITKALAGGYTSKQIIDFILRKFPQHADKIKSAMAAGFTVEQVLKFLGGGRKAINQESPSTTEHEQTRSMDINRAENVNKGALAAGGLALTPFASRAAGAALSRALPESLKNLSSAIGFGSIPGIEPNHNISPSQTPQLSSQAEPQKTILSQQPPVSETNIQQPQQINQDLIPQEIKDLQKSNSDRDELWKLAINGKVSKKGEKNDFLKYAKKLLQRGDIKDQETFEKFHKYWEATKGEKRGNPLVEFENFRTRTNGFFEPKENQSTTDQLPKSNEMVENIPPIEKKSIVSSPKGIGEVKEIRNGQALIDINGKLHKVPQEELEHEPKEIKEAKFDFDPTDIPEDLRSAPLNEVYLPHDKRHITVKYNAGLKPIRYIYWRKDNKNISTDYINKIVNGVQLPVSSGLNFWGSWDATKSDSRGAANYQELVSNSQEEGEPDDPSKDYWFIKEESIYTHPYQEKANDFLRNKEKEFNEKRKKRKKKTT